MKYAKIRKKFVKSRGRMIKFKCVNVCRAPFRAELGALKGLNSLHPLSKLKDNLKYNRIL